MGWHMLSQRVGGKGKTQEGSLWPLLATTSVAKWWSWVSPLLPFGSIG